MRARLLADPRSCARRSRHVRDAAPALVQRASLTTGRSAAGRRSSLRREPDPRRAAVLLPRLLRRPRGAPRRATSRSRSATSDRGRSMKVVAAAGARSTCMDHAEIAGEAHHGGRRHRRQRRRRRDAGLRARRARPRGADPRARRARRSEEFTENEATQLSDLYADGALSCPRTFASGSRRACASVAAPSSTTRSASTLPDACSSAGDPTDSTAALTPSAWRRRLGTCALCLARRHGPGPAMLNPGAAPNPRAGMERSHRQPPALGARRRATSTTAWAAATATWAASTARSSRRWTGRCPARRESSPVPCGSCPTAASTRCS